MIMDLIEFLKNDLGLVPLNWSNCHDLIVNVDNIVSEHLYIMELKNFCRAGKFWFFQLVQRNWKIFNILVI